MRSKSRRRSARSGLVLVYVLLGAMNFSAAAGANDPSVIKPSTGSSFALRMKGAIDALLQPLGLGRAAARGKVRSESEHTDLGPLE